MSPRLVPGALALALVASGCRTGFVSSPDDFSAYRATRVAPTFEERLAAAQRYLEERPDGVFRDEVRAYFDRAEQAYYASKRDSRTGLEAYLKALPEGPHRDEARSRIQDIDAVAHGDVDRTVATVEARIRGPGAAARTRVRQELDDWLARFLDAKVFRAPFSAAKAELIIPYSLSLPGPRCALLEASPPPTTSPSAISPLTPPPVHDGVARRCDKLLELPYEVEGPQGTEPREATLEVTLLEDAFGTPLEVTLGGPDLFLRLEETYRVKPIASDDARQRAASATRAAAFVQRVFDRAVSAADACARAAEPPVTLHLACEGIRVEVIPAAASGEDDRIVIAPAPAGRKRL